MPVSGINRSVCAGAQRRTLHRRATCWRCSSPTIPTRSCPAPRERWEKQLPEVPLVIVESPYRALVGPLLAYLDVLDQTWPADKAAPVTFVVIPEFVARHWWERILYNQSANRLRRALLGRRSARWWSTSRTGARIPIRPTGMAPQSPP